MVLSIYNFAMASPYPKQWLNDAVDLFNIDENFDFSNSIWSESILDTVKIEIEGIETSMKKAVELVEGIEELEDYKNKFNIEIQDWKESLKNCLNQF